MDAVFIEEGQHSLRITIDQAGAPDPSDFVQLIQEAKGEDGKHTRFFLCLGCRDLIEVPDGKKHVHECDHDFADDSAAGSGP